MRIERLSLKGLLRFTDPVTLDLRALPPGLVAITGDNGAGKTTLLEAMIAAVHRRFASREGELYDYATGRDSYLDAEIALDGRGVFHARVNLDGPKRHSDAVLEQLLPDGSRQRLSDGRVVDFDRAVGEVFPTPEVLLASAFAAQNKTGSFIALDKKARKELFLRLLALERYQGMSDTAKQAAGDVDQARGRLRAVRDTLARDTADALLQELDRLAHTLQIEGGTVEVRRVALQATIDALDARLAQLADQVAAHAAATQRVDTLARQHAEREAERATLTAQIGSAQTTHEAEIGRIDAERARALADTDTLLANNRKVQANAAQIRAAVEETAAATTALEPLRTRERELQRDLDDRDAAHHALQVALSRVQVRQEGLSRAEDDAATLGTVPCAGAGAFASCRFLTNARAAVAKLPALRQDVAQGVTVTANLASNRERQTAVRAECDAVRVAIHGHEQTIQRLQLIAQHAEKLARAEARIEELTRKRTEQAETADARTREAWARVEATMADLQQRSAKTATALSTAAGDLLGARREVDALTEGHARAITVQADLRTARLEWDTTTATLARVTAGVAELHRRRQQIAETRARVAALDTTLHTLDDELLDWQLLAKAFSRDGLPILEIDAAGPTITAYVNALLDACGLSRFTLELVTQRAKADGKGFVDDFSVRVFDNARGGEPRDIQDLSGGEQVLVAEALMNALAIYVNQTSPSPVRTCWRDETAGALDPENGRRYITMLRKVVELGGFHHCFFICHNADLVATADAQIHVADGQAAILLPPYEGLGAVA